MLKCEWLSQFYIYIISEREKEEERKKKEDEKRQKLEAEQNKNRKTAEAFAKFFVAKKVESKSDLNEIGEQLDSIQMPQTFMSFQVKDDMKIAPATRRTLNYDERLSFEKLLSSGIGPDDLYLKQLRNNKFAPRKSSRTWADDDDEKSSNDDLFVIGNENDAMFICKTKPCVILFYLLIKKNLFFQFRREWSKCATC